MIIMLCICNIIVTLGLLVLTYKYCKIASSLSVTEQNLGSEPRLLTKEEEVQVERAKRKYFETESAFQDMMNFNAYQAYGMSDPTKE